MPRTSDGMVKLTGLYLVLVMALAMVLAAGLGRAQTPAANAGSAPAPREGDFVVHDFHFQSGETLADVKMHYTTFGTPVTDASGRTTNAVLILHGTSGSGKQFLRPIFAGLLLGVGQLLDANK